VLPSELFNLKICAAFVNSYPAHIFTKLGAVDRAQAMAIAIKRQIIQLE
jgi:DNA-binding NarL/FixJ family response regulator